MKILPACFVVVGDTLEEARAKRAKLDSLVYYDNAIASLSIALGTDASKFDPDGPLPEISPKAMPARAGASARSSWPSAKTSRCASWRNASAAIAGCFGRHAADHRRSDGGMAGTDAATASPSCFRICRAGSTILRAVVPELQRRGLFRREYEGRRPAKISACRARGTGFFETRKAAE